MSIRAGLVGLVAGFLIAVVPGCGTATRCLASNCQGCCDDNGQCQAGDTAFACGAGALRCANCKANVEACIDSVCRPTGDGGTIIPPVDAGTCSAATCAGCCDSKGTCRGGNTNVVCGKEGAACASCAASQACTGNACVAAGCNSCRDQAGTCQAGNTPQSCGRDGGSCVACGGGQSCSFGACVSAPTCNASNCNGCCVGTQCILATTDAQCGSSGSQCVACQAPNTCQSGACVTPVIDAGPTGPCGPLTCPTGCCDLVGDCAGGSGQLSCGTGGVDCALCNPLNFQFCINKRCQ